ncbi:MAG: hypothetical protein J6A61_05945 [Clostridia bacterium]|nr:hypothetical protein [Clostridia bacterium]
MKILKRNNNVTESISTADHNQDEYLPNCQASFNSDGCVTLRNYDRSDRSKDEIIILSTSETEALFELFSRISLKLKNHTLPF